MRLQWITASLVIAAQLCAVLCKDFVYTTFADTQGLVFSGSAATSSCVPVPALEYGDVQGDADVFSPDVPVVVQETNGFRMATTLTTNDASSMPNVEKTFAGQGNRPDAKPSPTTRCAVRARLTPSRGNAAGSMWYKIRAPVTGGFETMFTFQITDQMRECTQHRDAYFSILTHETCTVRGGDGFAFVVQSDKNATRAVGAKGGQLGFGGISNSIAVAFDTWYNPGEGQDLLATDHISIHSMGTQPNSADTNSQFGQPRVHELADGLVHIVKIVYFPEIRTEYLSQFSASENMIPFLKDGGEGKRIGTFAVFIDDGIELNKPILAVPLSLSVLLDLSHEYAFIGFTAATGRSWQKHDILSWYWCDAEPCKPKERSLFDYHQQTKFYTGARLQKNTPGKGHSGGATSWPAKNQSPTNKPFGTPQQHFAPTKPEGLYAEASLQVPPNTDV